ncbi:hypothetical protein Prum_000190 [Phytohabitans rumicis]|uniref:Uncharacterized protein n=1 Tax=Phytohabitans rumicis TaxID=1076125 RepID=A0A6V8KX11_9ACTN|nr:hypothetical protein Prum_000190 [Phytohabitans rumicis]
MGVRLKADTSTDPHAEARTDIKPESVSANIWRQLGNSPRRRGPDLVDQHPGLLERGGTNHGAAPETPCRTRVSGVSDSRPARRRAALAGGGQQAPCRVTPGRAGSCACLQTL